MSRVYKNPTELFSKVGDRLKVFSHIPNGKTTSEMVYDRLPSLVDIHNIGYEESTVHPYSVKVQLYDFPYWEEYTQGLYYRVLWTDCDDSLRHVFVATQEEAFEIAETLCACEWLCETEDMLTFYKLMWW